MQKFPVRIGYVMVLFGLIFTSQSALASDFQSLAGGGGVTIDATAVSPASAIAVNPIEISAEFDSGSGSLVQIEFNGNIPETEARLKFNPSGFSVAQDGVNVENLQAEEDKISFNATGMGSLSLSDIGIYVSSGSTINSEQLKVTIDSASKTGENFTVDTFPLYADGSGSFSGNSDETYFRSGDAITYTPPENEDETFTIDLSSLGLSPTWPAGNGISLPQGLDMENVSFPVTVEFAGGYSRVFQSPHVSIDTTAPEPDITNILSIVGGGAVATVGDKVRITIPSDIHGDEVSLSANLNEIGGEEGIYEKITTPAETEIKAGSFNNENYSVVFTLYDKVGNFMSYTSNTIKLDNKAPELTLDCQGEFTVKNKGESYSNLIADYSNGAPDQVIFNAPNGNLEGCDFTHFSVDLSPISGQTRDNLKHHTAQGQAYTLDVAKGNLDNERKYFLITLFDENGNQYEYGIGPLNIDNDVADPSEIHTNENAPHFSTPDQELFVGDFLTVYLQTVESDISLVYVKIPEATPLVALLPEEDNPTVFKGQLPITGGPFVRTFLRVNYTLVDDAGNRVEVTGKESWFITNDNTTQYGGDGGTANLHRKDGVLRNEVNRAVVREQIQKYLEQKGVEDETENFDPLNEEEVPQLNDYLQAFKDKFGELEKQRLQEDLRELPAYKEPEFLENKIREVGFRELTNTQWQRYKDDEGGFRLQNTIDKLKRRNAYKRKKNEVPGSLRITELAQRGKYGKIRFDEGRFTVREGK